MQKRFYRFFYPSLFEGIDATRSAQLLNFVFRLTLWVTSISVAINLLLGSTLERIIPNLVIFLGVLLLHRILKKGNHRLAGSLYLVLTFAVIFLLVVFSGGIESPVFSMTIVVGFFAGVLLGGRAGLTFIATSLLLGGGLVALNYFDRLPVYITYHPIDFWIMYFVVYISNSALLFVVMKHLRDVLSQAQAEIGERRQAEASFQKLERRYKAIFEHTNDAVILMDFDSTILDINQRGIEMFGYEKADMVGRSGLDFIVPEEREAGREKLKDVIQGQTLPLYERKIVHQNGRHFSVEINLSLVFDENGTATQTQSVIRDISERKNAEAKLQEIEHRYRTLFEGSNDGIFIMGLDGVIEEVNQQAAKLLGYQPEEMIGKNASFFVVPEQKGNVQPQIDTLLKHGRIPIYERLSRKKDGTLITFEINAGIVYDLLGIPKNVQSIVRDISDRKKNEDEASSLIQQLKHQRAKIQTSLDVSKAAISILDAQTLIQQTVDLIKTQFEYYYVGLFLVDDPPRFAVLRAGTGEAGQKMLSTRHKLPIGEGSMIGWCIAHKEPRIALDVGLDAIRFDNPWLPNTRSEMALPLIARDEVIGALTVQSEIEAAFSEDDIAVLQVMTDLVAVAIDNARLHAQITTYAEELEQRVRERTAQLQTTNRELEAFSYSVSHDLRTPLRAINGYSSILLEDFSNEFSPQARAFQEKIRGNAIRMGDLVDGLLSFSRLGRKKIQKSEVDPSMLVQEILEELEPELNERKIEIKLGYLPPCEADPLLLKQVFINLISNAIKFTRDKDLARIEIGTQEDERGLAYFVKDNGAGFDMRYVDRLFGVFQRLHRDEEFEGTGVGLAIIQRIIHRHGGEVWANAKVGVGATFFFTLGGVAIDESGIFF